MPEKLRLFFALFPDDAARSALQRWQSCLPGRKTPPENLHITLAFLGEQPASLLDVLVRITGTLPFEKFRLKLDKPGYFLHNRVNWIGMNDIPAALKELQKRLAFALSENAIAFDRKSRFIPHVTLTRHADRAEELTPEPVFWDARHLALVRSRPKREKGNFRSEYILLAERFPDQAQDKASFCNTTDAAVIPKQAVTATDVPKRGASPETDAPTESG